MGVDSGVRRWRESTTAPVLTWLAVLAALVIGSRNFFGDGIPAVGEFLRFPRSPRELLDSYASGWHPNGLGATSATPTGWATLAGLSTLTLFRMGALHTCFVLGLLVVGLVGLWRLATVFPSTRARIAALVVYAASPLVAGAMSTGDLTVLVAFASTPWIVQTIRRAVGVETADPKSADRDLVDAVVPLPWPERLRRVAAAAIVVGLAIAFAPVMAPLAAAIVVVLTAGTILALAPWRTALRYLWVGLAAVTGGVLLNFPWFTTWTWEQLVGPSPIGDPGRGLFRLASFQIGSLDFPTLSLALYLPVPAAIVISRAWRLTWAVRSGMLVASFGLLAVLSDRGDLPLSGPSAGVLLVPVAVGLAISAAAALAAFDLDVRGGSFGWRQPLGILASAAVVVGVFPGVLAIGDGGWGAPKTPLSRLLEAQLPDNSLGDYNVLLIGDARILPVPSVEYRDGVSYAIIDDGELDIRDRWPAPTGATSSAITLALDEMATSSTLRAGRLLAPLGIRYVVAPEFDNVVSTTTDPLPLPGGLVDALEDQLDLTSITGLPTLEVFENTAWIPRFSELTGSTAAASLSAGPEALVRADLSAVTPLFVGATQLESATDDVVPGVVHLAVPFDDHWELTVNGEAIDAASSIRCQHSVRCRAGRYGDAPLSHGVAPLAAARSSGPVVGGGVVRCHPGEHAARPSQPAARR